MDDSFEFEDENKTIICKIQGEECVLVSGPAEQIVFAKITDPEKIRYIWFPSTLCLVSETDFGACTNLETIIADQTLEGWCSILFEFVRWDNYDLILTDGKTVKTALIPEGITETSETFYGCASIERVVFPKGFRTIGADCFYNCRNLKSAILPDTLKEIKSSAFENCVSLKAIDIPKSVNIESCVFAGCDNLARVGSNLLIGIVCFRAEFLFDGGP